MKKRLFWYHLVICVSVISCFATVSSAQDYPKMKLKFTSMAPAGSFPNKIAEWMVEDIQKATNGQVTFDTYWSGSLLGANEQLEGVQHGVTDLAIVVPGYFPGKLPLAYCSYAFPFAPRDPEVMVKLWTQLYDEFPWMTAELTKYNFKSLAWWTAADYAILTRGPVKGLKDLKGKKIAQLGGYFADWTKAAGIAPISGITIAERYERLRQGVVDGSLLPPDNFIMFKEYEVAKYMIHLGLGARPAAIVAINLDKFNTMPKNLQNLFIKVGKDVQKRHAEFTNKTVEQAIATMKAHGVTYFGYLPKADIAEWASQVPDTAATMCKSLEGQHPQIWSMAKRLIELAEQTGHKWPRKLAVRN
ncbi:MAG: TRAP transporter substrate-binding protein DctP [Deltaproteobacteria bacterium]|nr:TRAP transporter substrate-binding protein DctP [Deltaproteobacteria bacterium]